MSCKHEEVEINLEEVNNPNYKQKFKCPSTKDELRKLFFKTHPDKHENMPECKDDATKKFQFLNEVCNTNKNYDQAADAEKKAAEKAADAEKKAAKKAAEKAAAEKAAEKKAAEKAAEKKAAEKAAEKAADAEKKAAEKAAAEAARKSAEKAEAEAARKSAEKAEKSEAEAARKSAEKAEVARKAAEKAEAAEKAADAKTKAKEVKRASYVEQVNESILNEIFDIYMSLDDGNDKYKFIVFLIIIGLILIIYIYTIYEVLLSYYLKIYKINLLYYDDVSVKYTTNVISDFFNNYYNIKTLIIFIFSFIGLVMIYLIYSKISNEKKDLLNFFMGFLGMIFIMKLFSLIKSNNFLFEVNNKIENTTILFHSYFDENLFNKYINPETFEINKDLFEILEEDIIETFVDSNEVKETMNKTDKIVNEEESNKLYENVKEVDNERNFRNIGSNEVKETMNKTDKIVNEEESNKLYENVKEVDNERNFRNIGSNEVKETMNKTDKIVDEEESNKLYENVKEIDYERIFRNIDSNEVKETMNKTDKIVDEEESNKLYENLKEIDYERNFRNIDSNEVKETMNKTDKIVNKQESNKLYENVKEVDYETNFRNIDSNEVKEYEIDIFNKAMNLFDEGLNYKKNRNNVSNKFKNENFVLNGIKKHINDNSLYILFEKHYKDYKEKNPYKKIDGFIKEMNNYISNESIVLKLRESYNKLKEEDSTYKNRILKKLFTYSFILSYDRLEFDIKKEFYENKNINILKLLNGKQYNLLENIDNIEINNKLLRKISSDIFIEFYDIKYNLQNNIYKIINEIKNNNDYSSQYYIDLLFLLGFIITIINKYNE
jgi:hypothetical protein